MILNIRLRSTGGQATLSVLMGVVGKTTDFLATYLLVLPPQYVVMTYFSSSLFYINGVQVWCFRMFVVVLVGRVLSKCLTHPTKDLMAMHTINNDPRTKHLHCVV